VLHTDRNDREKDSVTGGENESYKGIEMRMFARKRGEKTETKSVRTWNLEIPARKEKEKSKKKGGTLCPSSKEEN